MPRPHRDGPGVDVRVRQRQADGLVPRADLEVARRAAEEQGVLSIGELMACGLDRQAIMVRERRGQLHPQHRGVYAVGHDALTLSGQFVAAVKACGAQAVLSHLAGLAHLDLIGWDDGWPIDVTVLGVGTRRHRGLRVHRTCWLEERDVWIRDAVPVTAPWRAILDAAALLPHWHLRRVVREAIAERKVTIAQLADVLARGGPRRGARRLARVLTEAKPTRSDLEDIVLDLVITAGFEPPDVNVPLWLDGRRVIQDFRWPEQHLVLEADSRQWHDDPLARADDAERPALLEAHGDRVLRVSWRQATTERRPTEERLARAGAPYKTPPRGTTSSA